MKTHAQSVAKVSYHGGAHAEHRRQRVSHLQLNQKSVQLKHQNISNNYKKTIQVKEIAAENLKFCEKLGGEFSS